MHFQYCPHLEKTLNIVLECITQPLSHFIRDNTLHSSQSSPSQVFSFAFIPFFIHFLTDFFVFLHDIRDHAFKAWLRLSPDRQEITLCLFLSCFQQTEVSLTFLITTKYGIFNPRNSYTASCSYLSPFTLFSFYSEYNQSFQYKIRKRCDFVPSLACFLLVTQQPFPLFSSQLKKFPPCTPFLVFSLGPEVLLFCISLPLFSLLPHSLHHFSVSSSSITTSLPFFFFLWKKVTPSVSLTTVFLIVLYEWFSGDSSALILELLVYWLQPPLCVPKTYSA